MKKIIYLTATVVVAFYAGQALACPSNVTKDSPADVKAAAAKCLKTDVAKLDAATKKGKTKTGKQQ